MTDSGFTQFKAKRLKGRTSEQDVEKYLVQQVKKRLGIAYKFTSPQRRSVPDRLCVLPNGVMFFVEVKKPGGLPTEKQSREHERLRTRDQRVHIATNRMEVDAILEVEYDDLKAS
jgi:hypothetical protein